jgi:hypothetical protein
MTPARPPRDGLPRARHGTSRAGSTAELVKHLAEQIGRLARDEVRLAQPSLAVSGRFRFSQAWLAAEGAPGAAACCRVTAERA